MKLNRFEYKGDLYKVIDSNSSYKDIDNGCWFKVVVYKSMKDKRVYVRDLWDFNNKFKRLSLTEYINSLF